jgi:RraA family protein
MDNNYLINPVVEPVDAALLSCFKEISTSLISDNLQRLEGVIGLRRVHRQRKMVGTAVTVKIRPGDNLLVYKALSMMTVPGHVLIVDAGGATSNAIVGNLLMAYAQERGCAGFVIDGAIRDSASFVDADFPCYARDVTHRGPFKTGPGSINIPVSIGGQVVQPGDVMVGDEDGIVVFKPSEVARLLAAVQRSTQAEEAIRQEIKTGAIEQSWMFKMFKANGIE